MKPLSIWTYYWNNKRKVVPIVGIIALAILAISSTGTLTGSLFDDAKRQVAFFERFASVFPTQPYGLSDGRIEELEGRPEVARVYRGEGRSTRIQGIFGSQGARMNFLAPEDQHDFAERLGWRLTAGRWPAPETNEVAVTENVLKNRTLKVGDKIGRLADPNDFLIGEWVIVGALTDGVTSGGVGDLSRFRAQYMVGLGMPPEVAVHPNVVWLQPAQGQEAALERYLDTLPTTEVGVNYATKVRRNVDNELENVNTIIWILNAISIVVLTLALGLLNIIFFMQRGNEFGLLAAIGYTKGFLMRRTFLESAVTVVVGWTLGILLAQVVYSVVNAVFFVPSGLSPLTVLTPRVLLFTVPVPVTVTLFSLAVVTYLLVKLDPVAIIERRD